MKVNKLGLGTAAIGRPSYINIKEGPTEAKFSHETFRLNGIAILDAAYEEGVRYFDTAPGYGMAEKMLTDWATKKDDASIEIATKWGYTYVADFAPNATEHEVKEHSLAKLREQWATSKDLLPKLTTYQIHSATFESGVLDNREVLRHLANLKNEHPILIGITTTGANQVAVLEKALDIKLDGNGLFDVFQVSYNIFDQSLAVIAEEIYRQKKRIVVKEALANGRIFPNKEYPHYTIAYEQLNLLAKKYNVGIDAIALRFCIDSIPLYKVLSGVSKLEHLIDNLRISKFKLETGELAVLRDLAITPELYWDERKKLSWN